MNNNILTAFNRNTIEQDADLGEKIGNIGLGLLRVGFGETLIIEKISDGADKIAFTQKKYSISAKVAAIALFIFALPITITLAGIGYAGTILSKSHKEIFNSYNQSKLVPITEIKPLDAIAVIDLETPKNPASIIQKAITPIADLWSSLNAKTQDQLKELEFLPETSLNHRFCDIHCPRETALAISGKYLHANKLGEGIAQRSFVASQAPLEQDYEIFWTAVLEEFPIIFDLTTIADLSNGVTKYYPEELNQTLTYGSMSVKLIGISDDTHTYQIKNVQTRAEKTIKRLHYVNWKDFSTVSLSKLQLLVEKAEDLSPRPKDLLWIHCRAGVGRTGTLITALVLKEKIQSREVNKENLDDFLVDIIVKLRKQRGPIFVQQKDQLNLLRDYANLLLTP